MLQNDKIAVFGANGMVGSAICHSLRARGYNNLLTPKSSEWNLCDNAKTTYWFRINQPKYVFLAAAKVGGIKFNIEHPVEFGNDNMKIIINVLEASHVYNVEKLLFLGSSCIYPKNCSQPMKEEDLLTGLFEPTNEMYAFSKAYGIKLCSAYRKQYNKNFISCQPCNLYGPRDNYDPKNSHVVAALIRKFHDAKIKNLPEVICWGDGSARREILYSYDAAEACVFLMENYNEDQFLNVGYGQDLTIKELTEKISNIVGYSGKILWDITQPSGMKQKLLNVEKIYNLGWKPKYDIDSGLKMSYSWFLNNITENK